jgi:hypothetical protein
MIRLFGGKQWDDVFDHVCEYLRPCHQLTNPLWVQTSAEQALVQALDLATGKSDNSGSATPQQNHHICGQFQVIAVSKGAVMSFENFFTE